MSRETWREGVVEGGGSGGKGREEVCVSDLCLYLCACVCVCLHACVCVLACICVCACVCVSDLLLCARQDEVALLVLAAGMEDIMHCL